LTRRSPRRHKGRERLNTEGGQSSSTGDKSFLYIKLICDIIKLNLRFVNLFILFMPSNTTSRMFFHYTYVLESLNDGKRYIGYTNNLRKRLEEHNKGKNFSTKFRLPFRLVYFEACINEQDAKRRENYLKTTQGRRFLGLRLIEYKRFQAFGSGS